METESSDLKNRYRNRKIRHLLLSLALDAVGMASFLIPGVGELGDVLWAPLAATAGFFMFGGMTGATGGLLTFAEEILPGTDWIPSLTLTWIYKYVLQGEKTFQSWSHKHHTTLPN